MNELEDDVLEHVLRQIDFPEAGEIAIVFAVGARMTRSEADENAIEETLRQHTQQIIVPLEHATSLILPSTVECVFYDDAGLPKMKNFGRITFSDDRTSAKIGVIVDITRERRGQTEELQGQLTPVAFTLGHELFHGGDPEDHEPRLSEHLADTFPAVLIGRTNALRGFSRIFTGARTSRDPGNEEYPPFAPVFVCWKMANTKIA